MAALLITAGGVLAVLPARAAEGSLAVVVLDDLSTGEVITPAMLREQSVGDPPDGALTAEQTIGRALAAPVRRGEVLTDARLVPVDGPNPGPGRVAVPVRLDDPGVVALLRPGVHVAVLAVDPDGPDSGVTAVDPGATTDPADPTHQAKGADGPGDDATAADTPDGRRVDGEPVSAAPADNGMVVMLAADAVVLSVPTASGSSPLRTTAGATTVLIAVPDEAADSVAAHAALGTVTVRFT